MSEYTPTTEEIRAGWTVGETRDGYGVDHDDFAPKVSAEFNRWLDQVRAVARREGQAEAWDDGNRFGIAKHCDAGCYEDRERNPYRNGAGQ